MKKLMITMMMVAFVATSAFAASDARLNTGCGLGYVVFGENNNGTLLQSIQAILNGISGNQTFGITSGTSGCKKPAKFVSNERVEEFVRVNIDNLAKDIAMGQGESLTTLAELMQVEDSAAFGAKLQANFDVIFPSADVEYAHVVDSIVGLSA